MTVPMLLIDGYNLLFESDLVGKGRGPGWLQRARDRLLKRLAGSLSERELSSALVIFDAPKAGRSAMFEQEQLTASAPRVVFAFDHEEADDLLEKLIREHPSPKLLRVVSSDHRIRRAAQARRANSISSTEYLEELAKRPSGHPSHAPEDSSASAKPTERASLDSAEVDYWLAEFNLKPKKENE